MRKTTVVVAFAAGLLGGIASRYFSPQAVHAQSLPSELRAQKFVLVDERGAVLGILAQESGRSALKLFDADGREIWSAGGKVMAHNAHVGK